jgi:hypothetical protein
MRREGFRGTEGGHPSRIESISSLSRRANAGVNIGARANAPYNRLF